MIYSVFLFFLRTFFLLLCSRKAGWPGQTFNPSCGGFQFIPVSGLGFKASGLGFWARLLEGFSNTGSPENLSVHIGVPSL